MLHNPVRTSTRLPHLIFPLLREQPPPALEAGTSFSSSARRLGGCRATFSHGAHVRVLAIAMKLLVLAQLPLKLLHAGINARVGVALPVAGDEYVVMLGIHNHFDLNAVFLN